jgi:hypothetical protein
MTMLIELDSDNRASLRKLFDRYPYVHGSVAAVIEGGMGRVFADAQEMPLTQFRLTWIYRKMKASAHKVSSKYGLTR